MKKEFIGMLPSFISRLANGDSLSASEMAQAMALILQDTSNESEVISFLAALREKGETSDEITGAVKFLRSKMIPLPLTTARVMDTCGTGGDGKNTFNISTAAAFVVAGADIPVAKHGNRAVSSACGSADVLRELGVNVDATPLQVARCVDEIGIGFLFAPTYHATLKNVAVARKKLGTRSIFNILGPLMNPAGATWHVIGVYAEHLVPIVAQALANLGVEGATVVWGRDGLDELTLTTTSHLARVNGKKITQEDFDPALVGYPYCRLEDLAGGDAGCNAQRLRKVLKGHSEPLDHVVHLNAALAIQTAGRAVDFMDALLMAQESISSGKAYQKLEALIDMSHQE